MKVKIRPGKLKDAKDFVRISTEAFPTHDVNSDKKYFIIHIKKKEAFIADVSKKIVGYITFSEGFWGTDTIFIHMFAVDKDYRKKGIGEALLNKVIAVAKEKGFRRIFLDTWSGNKEVISFYKKRGFERCGYTDNLYREGERCPILSLKVKR